MCNPHHPSPPVSIVTPKYWSYVEVQVYNIPGTNWLQAKTCIFTEQRLPRDSELCIGFTTIATRNCLSNSYVLDVRSR